MNRRSAPYLSKFLLFFLTTVLLSGCSHCGNLAPDAVPEPLPAFYVPEKIRVALVLGSGGIRGMAHVGVLEELEAAGIEIDLIVGCSAGSIVGAIYADNPCAAKIKKTVWDIKTNSILDIDLWHCRYGLSSGRCLRRVLARDLCAETFDELKIPLIVVATDLNSGELVPMGGGNLVEAVQASCSIPFVFIPCEHLGRVLVDGGTINPVPVKVARDLGAEVIIAVDLSELLTNKFPTNLFGVTDRSADIAFIWQNENCARDADVVIRPKTCDVGTFNEKMKAAVYKAGRDATREKMPEILEAVGKLSEKPTRCGWRLIHPTCYTSKICIEEEELVEAEDN